MDQLDFFIALVLQASLAGFGLLAAGATLLVLERRDRRRTSRLLVLPLIWIAPLALGSLFMEPTGPDPKTADWLRHVALAILPTYLVATIVCMATLPGARRTAAGCAAINAPFAALSTLTLSMAASGHWL